MHPISFHIKRTHLSIVACGRKIFEDAKIDDMTPARFDLLYLLHDASEMRQAEVRRRLGLSGATVSVMVKRLVELGLVVKGRATRGDRRVNVLRLTEDGAQRIRRALYEIFTLQRIGVRFVEFVATKREALESLWRSTVSLARKFGDRAEAIYSYGLLCKSLPDEADPCGLAPTPGLPLFGTVTR